MLSSRAFEAPPSTAGALVAALLWTAKLAAALSKGVRSKEHEAVDKVLDVNGVEQEEEGGSDEDFQGAGEQSSLPASPAFFCLLCRPGMSCPAKQFARRVK